MIILVGIPGCGKTTILAEAKKAVPSLQVVNYGDKMLEVAGLQKRDLIRKLPVDEQKKMGLTVAKRIVEEASATTVVDTHALIKTGYGYCPGLPKEILEILAPDACILIECAPAIMIQRRTLDNKRVRDLDSEEELLMHQELSRHYLCACSLMTGALFCRINNSEGSPAQNVLPIIRMVESLQK